MDMKKMLSRVGIGAAKVDAELPKTSYELGESGEAQINIRGGSAEQEVDRVYLALLTTYEIETEDGHTTSTAVIDKFKTSEPFTIGPDQEKSFSVSFRVPYHAPISMGRSRVWIKTGLDVDWSVDPDDEDAIQVQPDARMRALFDAIESLGFGMHTAKCKQGERLFSRPYAQEFAFRPSGDGPYAGRVNELELICDPSPEQVQVVVELDRRAGGLLGAFGGEFESKSHLSFTEPDSDAIRRELEQTINARLG